MCGCHSEYTQQHIARSECGRSRVDKQGLESQQDSSHTEAQARKSLGHPLPTSSARESNGPVVPAAETTIFDKLSLSRRRDIAPAVLLAGHPPITSVPFSLFTMNFRPPHVKLAYCSSGEQYLLCSFTLHDP